RAGRAASCPIRGRAGLSLDYSVFRHSRREPAAHRRHRRPIPSAGAGAAGRGGDGAHRSAVLDLSGAAKGGLNVPRAQSPGRWLIVISLMAASNAAVLLLCIMIGEYPVPAGEAWKAVLGAGDPAYHFVVNELRLPRSLVAFLVGCGLALSGA